MYGDYFLYNWCTSEGKGSGGSGGGSPGDVGEGCGVGFAIFMGLFVLMTLFDCNGSQKKEYERQQQVQEKIRRGNEEAHARAEEYRRKDHERMMKMLEEDRARRR